MTVRSLMHPLTLLLFALLATSCDDKEQVDLEREPELKQFSLVVPEEFEVAPYSDAFRHWTSSLIKNLGYQRDQITCEELLRTNLQLTSKGQPVEGIVYIQRSNPDVFFIRGHHLTIDFEKQVIGTGGVGGLSVHFSTSGQVGAFLSPTKNADLLGVPLGDDKTTSPKPLFTDPTAVTYELAVP